MTKIFLLLKWYAVYASKMKLIFLNKFFDCKRTKAALDHSDVFIENSVKEYGAMVFVKGAKLHRKQFNFPRQRPQSGMRLQSQGHWIRPAEIGFCFVVVSGVLNGWRSEDSPQLFTDDQLILLFRGFLFVLSCSGNQNFIFFPLN